MIENIKMAIARLLNHYNNVCWVSLVLWAMGYVSWREVDFTGRCKRPPYFDQEWGGCKCGKHMTEAQKKAMND